MKITEDEETELYNASHRHYQLMEEGDKLLKKLALGIALIGISTCALFIFIAVRYQWIIGN